MSDQDSEKKAAARAALEYVKPQMKVGLGTGSTARRGVEEFVNAKYMLMGCLGK